MAIESAVLFRRVARFACLVLVAGLLCGGAALAQLPIKAPAQVTVGSVIPFSHGGTGAWSEIYSMKIDPLHGNILFLDSALSELFQLSPGASAPELIAGPAPSTGNSDCSDLEKAGSYWNAAIAFDKWDNLYITDRYGSSVQFCRVPYSASQGTWTFSSADKWTGPTYTTSTGSQSAIAPQDLQVADDGVTFYVTTSSTKSIYKYTVNESGTVTSTTTIATGLEDMVSNIAVDHAGNLFFIENAYDQLSARVAGIREIPANSAPIVGDTTGSAEQALTRIDQGVYNGVKGMYFDAQGNLYFASENNAAYGGYVDGVFMIPNEGTPTAPNLVWADTVEVSPVSSGFPPLIDARGLVWLATGGSGNWVPSGTNGPTCDTTTTQTADATCLYSTIVLWKPGAANLGAAGVGGATTTKISAYSESANGNTLTLTANNSFIEDTAVTISAGATDPLYALNGLTFYVAGTGLSSTSFQISTSLITAGSSGSTAATAGVNQTQAVYYMFNQPTTPASFAFAQPSGSNFLATANPTPNTTATAPVLPCTAGNAYPAFSPMEDASGLYSFCPYYVRLNSAVAGSVGTELQMLNSSNNVIAGGNAYLSGVGQGSMLSVVASAAVQTIATASNGLNDPLQVAADAWGNSYVADNALKSIERFAAGTTNQSGKVYGTGLSSPTGVAVDGTGDLYIGDSGKVIEIPYVNGALDSSEQTTLPLAAGTTLGAHLSLATDGFGDVFVADKDNKQVVEIPNPGASLLMENSPDPVLGASAGFTGPSAIATDSSGNVWVADGSNLWEISMPFGGASEVLTKGLQAPVTGLAVDPSGSVFVAGSTGLVWIPFNAATGSLNINGQVLVSAGLGSSGAQVPYGVALDASGDAYASYGSGSTAGLAQLGIGGSVDFSNYGEVNPNVQFEVDAQIFNLGNTPLAVSDSPAADLFTGVNASDYTVGAASENSPACSATTSTAPGGSCYLGLFIQAPSAGQASASVSVASNAANATSGANIAVTADVIADPRPATQITFASIPNVVYPGSVTITVTVTTTNSGYGTPAGTVILSVGSANGNLPKQTQTLNSSGSATFTYTNLLGGSYNVNADYNGDGTAGATQNSCTPAGSLCFAGSANKTSFTVMPATPVYTVGPPVTTSSCLTATGSCQPNTSLVTTWAGNTYVKVSGPVYIVASVTSTVGTPTGTVTFMSNGKPADPTQGVNGAIPLNGNGVAVFSTSNLVQGVYNLSAVYSGDVNYAAKTTQLPAFYVIPSSVQITAPAGTVSITPGTPTQVTLTLEPLVGFVSSSNPVSLECNSPGAPVQIAPTTPSTALPPYTECTFAYSNTVTGTQDVGITSGTSPATIVLTISTNVPVNLGTTGSVARDVQWSLAGVFGLGLLGLIAGRKRVSRYLSMICLAAMLSSAFAGITSCTNAGYSTPPPAPKVTTPTGTYNVQIITYDPGNLQQNSLTNPVFTLPVQVQ